MRVYEIAKEAGIPTKDLLAKIRALGIEANNHMSSLDADDVARIKRSLEKEKQSVAQFQQTQRLASGGALLRRRRNGDRPAEDPSDDRSTERAATLVIRRRIAGDSPGVFLQGPPAPSAAPTPVIRGRVVAEDSPDVVSQSPPAPSAGPAPVIRRRVVVEDLPGISQGATGLAPTLVSRGQLTDPGGDSQSDRTEGQSDRGSGGESDRRRP